MMNRVYTCGTMCAMDVMWYPADTIHVPEQCAARRLLLRVTSLSESDNEDQFLNSAITSTLNLALNLVPCLFSTFVLGLAVRALRMRLMTPRGHGHCEAARSSGNRK